MNIQAAAGKYMSALVVTKCIFFFWGFAASGNALLIPVLKEQFKLTQFKSQLAEMTREKYYSSLLLVPFF